MSLCWGRACREHCPRTCPSAPTPPGRWTVFLHGVEPASPRACHYSLCARPAADTVLARTIPDGIEAAQRRQDARIRRFRFDKQLVFPAHLYGINHFLILPATKLPLNPSICPRMPSRFVFSISALAFSPFWHTAVGLSLIRYRRRSGSTQRPTGAVPAFFHRGCPGARSGSSR